MNADIEKKISRFFQKRVRERVLYLMSSKKRGEIFGKLAHTAEEYLDCTLIVEKSDFPFERGDIEKYLGKRVYVMEEHSALDGKFAATAKALDELWSCGVPYLLYGNGYLYVETEYDFSAHTAYLLKGHDKP
ncbi:MAG: hypothetical protein K2J80_11015 [Oscillospiraceae bacterium]|nr:hypothetical protein [Oscillospiraceae bacterium]